MDFLAPSQQTVLTVSSFHPPAPLTSREQEMADIREAEGVEVVGSSVRRNHAGAQIGMPWDDSVDEAFQALKDGQKKVVQLVRPVCGMAPCRLNVPIDND